MSSATTPAATARVTVPQPPKPTHPRSPYPIKETNALREAYLTHRRYIDEWNRWYASVGVMSATDYCEYQCQQFADRPAIEYVGQESTRLKPITYGELNLLANRLASYWLQQGLLSDEVGVGQGGTICVLIENSPFFLVTWLSLAKLGLTSALLNTGLKERQLRHSISISSTSAVVRPGTVSLVKPKQQIVIVSEAFRATWEATEKLYEADGQLAPKVFWTKGGKIEFGEILRAPTTASTSPNASLISHIEDSLTLSAHIANSSANYQSYRGHIHWESPLFLIYTSGTTGPSKAAIFSQRRFLGAGLTWAYPMDLTSEDKYYIVLPLYHGNGGVVAVSACMHVGCTMVIREKFSVSAFWKDVRLHQCTAMIYVGELWRYLFTAPPQSDDAQNPLRVIAGNGLRPDIWEAVMKRFGLEKVVEHYGMTEMPAGPYMNFYGRVGACGFIPPEIRAKQGADKLVQFDVESGTVVRHPQTGRCIEVTQPNDVGEALFLLAPGLTGSQADNPHTESGAVDQDTSLRDALGNPLYKPYRNYTDVAACEKRVYRHVFEEKDAWFATGDLLKRDADGFFYFCDRIGDTYRWKGENVATNDVAEVLCAFPAEKEQGGLRIKEANVYGVEWPGYDGKAGMACLVLDEPQAATDSTTSTSSSSPSQSHELNTRALLRYLHTHLASFAIPAFLRVRAAGSENSKTSTLKFQKVTYAAEGFHPERCAPDRVYFWPGARLGKQQQEAARVKGEEQDYVLVTMENYPQIVSPPPPSSSSS